MADETNPGDEPLAENPKYDQDFFLALAAKGKDAWNAWRHDPANKGVCVTFAGIDFSEAPRDEIDFSGFEFGDGADFSRCRWRGGWTPPFLLGRAAFFGAAFGDSARFDDAVFGAWATFADATFGEDALFVGATFGRSAIFSGVAFGDGARFDRRNGPCTLRQRRTVLIWKWEPSCHSKSGMRIRGHAVAPRLIAS
jgi:hypothetical protein